MTLHYRPIARAAWYCALALLLLFNVGCAEWLAALAPPTPTPAPTVTPALAVQSTPAGKPPLAVEPVPVPVLPLPAGAFAPIAPAPETLPEWPALGEPLPVQVDPYVVPPPALDVEPTRYRIAARLDPQSKVITGTQTVEFTNVGSEAWSEVWFHLFPNAFAVEAGAPTFVSLEREYPHGFNPAFLRVEADTPVEAVPDANGKETLLRATLAQPVAPGARGVIALRFVAKLPEAQSRFSYWDDVYSVGNWYPVLAMYEHGEWRRDPYYAIGDPFYTPVALYEVALQVPKDFLVGSTGVEQSRDDTDANLSRHDITTGLVRDFAFAASPRYHEYQREAGPVTVRVLAFDERGGEVAADTAAQAIRFYGETYGAYPYRLFTAAETSFPGGMEYPTLVLLGSGLYQPSAVERGLLNLLVAHETAHQWWYGLVGDDQIQEPWLDEAMAQFSMYRFMQSQGQDAKPSHNANYDDAGLMRRSVISYGKDDGAYNYQLYEHGAEILFKLRDAVGPDTFDQIMRTYFQRWEYRIAHVDDFVAVVGEIGGQPGLDALAPYLSRQ